MSKFFESPVVRAAVTEINELQEAMTKVMFKHPAAMTKEDRENHLEMMKSLLEKQKLFYTRLKLSDDPKAIEMKENIMESAKFLGLKKDQPIEQFFDGLMSVLDSLEERLDDPASWVDEDVDEDGDWMYNQ